MSIMRAGVCYIEKTKHMVHNLHVTGVHGMKSVLFILPFC